MRWTGERARRTSEVVSIVLTQVPDASEKPGMHSRAKHEPETHCELLALATEQVWPHLPLRASEESELADGGDEERRGRSRRTSSECRTRRPGTDESPS